MTLRYPKELSDDYVVFTPEPYRANAADADAGTANTGVAGATETGGGPPTADPNAQSVILYMPNSTPGIGNGQNWSDSGSQFMGPFGAVKRNLVSAVGEQVYGDGFSADAALQSVEKQFKSISSQAGGVAKQLGMEAVSGMAGTTANAVLAVTKGQVYNPNVELLYSMPQMRTFDFQFEFVPKSREEARTMNEIILNFKTWSAPAENGSMFDVPYIWKVSYMTGQGENQYMNRFKKAALKSINIQANPSTSMHVAHEDGIPVSTAMSLQFMEVDIITRDDHENAGGQGF